MSAKKRKKKRSRKPNPFGSTRRSKPKFKYRTKTVFKNRGRRRNPGDDVKDDLVIGGAAAAGLVASRLIPQNVPFLSTYNTGIPGYGLNLLTGLGLSWVLNRFAKMPNIARGVRYGTYAGMVARAFSDYAGMSYITVQNSAGQTVSGLGRVRTRGDAAFSLRGLGARYMTSYSPTPTSSGADFTAKKPWAGDIAALNAAPAAAAVAKAKGVSGLSYNPNYRSRMTGGRFAA
jgi:hypothetical protein